MPSPDLAATLTPVTTIEDAGESRGRAIERRMKLIGLKPGELASEAGVSKGTVYRVFRDEPNLEEQSYTRLERALDRIEFEHGHGAPGAAVRSTEAGLIEFEVTGDFGVRVVVKGPVENAAELEASVARLIRDIRQANDG